MGIPNGISSIKKTISTATDVQKKIANHLAKHPEAAKIKPLCQEFWEGVDFKRYYRRCGNVTYHGNLNGINHHLTTGSNPEGLRIVFFNTGVTPKEMIEVTDVEFKVLPKTTKTIIGYRCVGEKPEFFKQDYARYIKSKKVKKGDIITMPEYAYATSDKGYAEIYLNNGCGIMYEIEIPPESRISLTGHGINNEIVFPRSSKFECIDVEERGNITFIKLKYIKPFDYTG